MDWQGAEDEDRLGAQKSGTGCASVYLKQADERVGPLGGAAEWRDSGSTVHDTKPGASQDGVVRTAAFLERRRLARAARSIFAIWPR